MLLISNVACAEEYSITINDEKIKIPQYDGFQLVSINSNIFNLMQKSVKQDMQEELLALYLPISELDRANTNIAKFSKVLMFIKPSQDVYFSREQWDKVRFIRSNKSKKNGLNLEKEKYLSDKDVIQLDAIDRQEAFSDIVGSKQYKDGKIILSPIVGTTIIFINNTILIFRAAITHDSEDDLKWIKHVSNATIDNLFQINASLAKNKKTIYGENVLPESEKTMPWGMGKDKILAENKLLPTNNKNQFRTINEYKILDHLFTIDYKFSNKGLSEIILFSEFTSKYPLSECQSLYNYLKNVYGDESGGSEISSGKRDSHEYVWPNLKNSSLDAICLIDDNKISMAILIQPKWEILECSFNLKEINKTHKIKFYFDSWNNNIKQFDSGKISPPIKGKYNMNEISFTTIDDKGVYEIDRLTGKVSLTLKDFLDSNGEPSKVEGNCVKKLLETPRI